MAVITESSYLSCMICGKQMKLLNNKHLSLHGLTPTEYSERFPDAPTYTRAVYDNNRKARKEYANTDEAKRHSSKTGKKNKGSKRSIDWCERRSKRYSGEGNPFYGKTHKEETRRSLSAHFQGVPLEDWGGYVNSESKRLWKSKRASRWSREVFERDNYTCALCDKRGGDLEAHHIVPRRSAPELVYENDNGITLCKPCHRGTFGKEHLFEERLGKMVKEKNQSGKSSKVLKSLL